MVNGKWGYKVILTCSFYLVRNINRNKSFFKFPQAVERPWDEDPFTLTEEVMKNISMEVVREKMLDHVHQVSAMWNLFLIISYNLKLSLNLFMLMQEIPYNIEHLLMDWKELRDGSVRIEQHFITPKMSQRKILVGKKGSKIG